MTKHLFLSHSHLDKSVADLVLNCLESRGIRCWVAPRDVSAGGSYAASIVDAIENAHSLILIYTINCNTSPHVLREVERALHVGINIIPIRFDDSMPSKSLNYLLATVHWLSVGESFRNIDVAKAVDRIALTISEAEQTNGARRVEDAIVQPPLEFPTKQTPTTHAVSVNGRSWVIGILIAFVVAGFWYVISHQPGTTPPSVSEGFEKSASPTSSAVTPTREVSLPEGPQASPVATPVETPIPVATSAKVPRATPIEWHRSPEAAPVIPTPTPQRQNVEQLPLKGAWSQVIQKTFDHTIDLNTAKLVLDGNRFVYTKTTKVTLRPGIVRPREVPKGVQSFSHVTRYTGEVIFRNRDMIKIKLLSVDFPVRYPPWLSNGKKMEQNDANYVSAKAVWTLRWAGENLVDAEEATTILRPER